MKIAVLTAGAIFLGWQVVKASAVPAMVRNNLPAAAMIAPDNPVFPFRLAMAEFRQNGGRVSDRSTAAAVEALRKAPLAEEPFLLRGLSALIARDDRASEDLLTEARRRNPRSRATRLLLLDRYLKTDRVDAAAGEIAVLTRLMPAANEVLIPELGKLGTNPETRAALAQTLRSDPLLQQEVLRHLASTGASPEAVLQLASASASPGSRGARNDWQAILIQKRVEKGEFARAYSMWNSFLGAGAAAGKKTGVYDGGFEGKPGWPPFNWAFAADSAGVAERGARGGLQVEYFGRVGGDLASQLLMLPKGRHRLVFNAEGEAEGKSSRLTWKIECLPSKSVIGEIPIRTDNYVPRQLTGTFQVPASGCSAQALRLVGIPAEFPQAQSLTLTDVRVEGAN